MSAIVLLSKPGLTSLSAGLTIPATWDPVWFKNLINNVLKGADVRNAIAGPGITITGNLASPYATISIGGNPAVINGMVTINGTTTPSGNTGVLTVNGVAGNYTASFFGPTSPAGQSFGVNIEAGTNSSDIALVIGNAANTQRFFEISGAGKILGLGPTAGGLVDMTPDTGTFTGTFPGFSTTVTGTVVWSKNGNQITMTVPAFSGTSNTTSLSMTGIPAEIQPTRAQNYALPPQNSLENSGAAVTSCGMHIDAGSTITFYINGSSVGWAASGTKGNLAAFSFTYLLN
jgi:hypothetical protein